jgi:hypothetical protein
VGPVSGAPLKTAIGGDRVGSQSDAYEAAVVMGWCIHEHEAGEGGWRLKHRIQAALGAPLKMAIGGDRAGSQGGAYEAAAVMGWYIREHEAGEGGWRPKHRIRAAMAQFRVCHAKQQ